MTLKVSRPTPETLIGDDEVITSTDLIQRMVDHGYTNQSARQAIRRTLSQNPAFWRSEALQLSRGVRLFARQKFRRRRGFYQQVSRILNHERPGLARCISKLAAVGVLSRTQAWKLLASPAQIAAGRTYPSFDSELEALREVGVQVLREGTAFEYLLGAGRKANDHHDQMAADAITVLRKEALLARILIERLRRQNLVSWSGTDFPRRDGHSVTFNDQLFTARGFCFLGPVRRQIESPNGKRPKPAPVLFDVHAGRCTTIEVESFLERAKRATCRSHRQHSYLGVVAAKEFDRPAWQLVRSHGLLGISFRQMFGDEALEAMARVEQVIEAFQHEADPDAGVEPLLSFAASLEELKANPVVADLRSIGFELLTGMGMRSNGFEGVEFGLHVPYKKTEREVDVHGKIKDDVWLVECKAYHSKKMIAPEDVSKFFKETVPSFIKWWQQKNARRPERYRAQIWTTGQVGSEAKRQLERIPFKPSIEPAIVSTDDILEFFPSTIRDHCSRMLKSIAMAETSFGDNEE